MYQTCTRFIHLDSLESLRMELRMRVFMKKSRVELKNESKVFLESLEFEIEMRVSQKSDGKGTASHG